MSLNLISIVFYIPMVSSVVNAPRKGVIREELNPVTMIIPVLYWITVRILFWMELTKQSDLFWYILNIYPASLMLRKKFLSFLQTICCSQATYRSMKLKRGHSVNGLYCILAYCILFLPKPQKARLRKKMVGSWMAESIIFYILKNSLKFMFLIIEYENLSTVRSGKWLIITIYIACCKTRKMLKIVFFFLCNFPWVLVLLFVKKVWGENMMQ